MSVIVAARTGQVIVKSQNPGTVLVKYGTPGPPGPGLTSAVSPLHLDPDTDALTVDGATTTSRGVITLAGDLAGNTDAPTVPGLTALQDDLADETTARQSADTELQTAIDTINATLPNKADLVNNKVPSSQLPALAAAFTVEQVANQTARLALPANVAYMCKQADTGAWWVIDATKDPSVAGNWVPVDVDPTAHVDSVNGQIGTVVLGFTDVGADAAGAAAAAQAAAAADATSKANTAQANAEAASDPAGTAAALIAALAAVARSGAYQDLTGLPNIGAQYDPTRIDIFTSGALTPNRIAWVATGFGPVTRTLPTTASLGDRCLIGKASSDANAVTVTGNINGTALASTQLLVPGQHVELIYDGTATWWVLSGTPVDQLDSRYQLAGSAVGANLAYSDLSTGVSSITLTAKTGGVVQWADITGAPLAISPTLTARAVEIETCLTVQQSNSGVLLVGIYDATAAAVIAATAQTGTAGGFFVFRTTVQVNPGAGTRIYRPMLGNNETTTMTATVYGKNVNSVESYIKATQR